MLKLCGDSLVGIGFSRVMTVARYTGGNVRVSVSGSTPEELLPYIADAVVRQISWQLMFTVGMASGTLRPLVLLSPILAETIAKAGCSKYDVKEYFFENTRISAGQFERILRDWSAARQPSERGGRRILHEAAGGSVGRGAARCRQCSDLIRD